MTMTMDVARKGRDKTVFNIWEGLESVRRETYGQILTDRTIVLIRGLAVIPTRSIHITRTAPAPQTNTS